MSSYFARLGDSQPPRLLVALQLPLAPMVVFAAWIEHSLFVAMYCLQCSGAGEEQRVALFGGSGQVISRVQYLRMIMLGFRHGLAQVLDRISQGDERLTVRRDDRIVEAAQPTLVSHLVESPLAAGVDLLQLRDCT